MIWMSVLDVAAIVFVSAAAGFIIGAICTSKIQGKKGKRK